ncbi:MAG: GTPase, partial [Pseudomonadota bacterium]
MDTIYALASGVGAVAVFRVSGPRAAQVLSALSAPDAPPPAPRHAELRALRRPDDCAPLDQALCLWFPAPRSFTGEDVVEIHGHGGAIGVAALAAAMEAAGARLARPGEFSRRAVLNGKIDLSQAEGLAAAIAAETEAERRHAQSVLRGAVGEAAARWRARLLRAAALCETQIDFIDEDVGADIDALAADELAALLRELREHAADVARADSYFGVPQIAIIGPPNAGKSSLLNRIAREDRAIVADRPGTTRDVLRARLNGPDGAFELIDTAGLRDAEDEVEAEGVRRAQAAAQAADLVVLAVSADTLPALWDLAPPPAADAVFWTNS